MDSNGDVDALRLARPRVVLRARRGTFAPIRATPATTSASGAAPLQVPIATVGVPPTGGSMSVLSREPIKTDHSVLKEVPAGTPDDPQDHHYGCRAELGDL